MLRRRKSRAKMQFGSPTNGDGDFEDNVFEVEEGGGRTGEISLRKGKLLGVQFNSSIKISIDFSIEFSIEFC